MARRNGAQKKLAGDVAKQDQPAPPSGAGKEAKDTTQVRVTKGFHRRLKLVAADLGIEMGQLVEEQIEDYLKREEDRMFLEQQARRAASS